MENNPKNTSEKPSGNGSIKDAGAGNEVPKYKSLVIQGDSYKTQLTYKYENRKKWVKPNEKLIYSFIPGTVTEIFVKPGQTLKKGDKLLMFEAMKMLNSIEMPVNGKIKKLNVNIGDRVPKGSLMIELS
jgi:biotin carboxyl carrier protein